jgi:hypothetical protein
MLTALQSLWSRAICNSKVTASVVLRTPEQLAELAQRIRLPAERVKSVLPEMVERHEGATFFASLAPESERLSLNNTVNGAFKMQRKGTSGDESVDFSSYVRGHEVFHASGAGRQVLTSFEDEISAMFHQHFFEQLEVVDLPAKESEPQRFLRIAKADLSGEKPESIPVKAGMIIAAVAWHAICGMDTTKKLEGAEEIRLFLAGGEKSDKLKSIDSKINEYAQEKWGQPFSLDAQKAATNSIVKSFNETFFADDHIEDSTHFMWKMSGQDEQNKMSAVEEFYARMKSGLRALDPTSDSLVPLATLSPSEKMDVQASLTAFLKLRAVEPPPLDAEALLAEAWAKIAGKVETAWGYCELPASSRPSVT